MKNVNLNDRFFESHTHIMEAVADSFNANENVLSAYYDNNEITVHEVNNETGEEETIEWYCDEVIYNDDNSVASVNIDC